MIEPTKAKKKKPPNNTDKTKGKTTRAVVLWLYLGYQELTETAFTDGLFAFERICQLHFDDHCIARTIRSIYHDGYEARALLLLGAFALGLQLCVDMVYLVFFGQTFSSNCILLSGTFKKRARLFGLGRSTRRMR